MRELYGYVWRSSAPQQIVLIVLAISAAILAAAPLELQRHIINTLAGREKLDRLGFAQAIWPWRWVSVALNIS